MTRRVSHGVGDCIEEEPASWTEKSKRPASRPAPSKRHSGIVLARKCQRQPQCRVAMRTTSNRRALVKKAHPVAATASGRGAETGELSAGVDSIIGSATFSPALLFSLSSAVLLSLALLPLGCEISLLSLLSSFGNLLLGARHDDNSQTTPVKLLS